MSEVLFPKWCSCVACPADAVSMFTHHFPWVKCQMDLSRLRYKLHDQMSHIITAPPSLLLSICNCPTEMKILERDFAPALSGSRLFKQWTPRN